MPSNMCGSVSARFRVCDSDCRRSRNVGRSASSTFSPAGSCDATPASPATTCNDARFLELASVSNSVPVGKSNDASPTLAGGLVLAGRHLNRPAIIRWKTRKSLSSISHTMRFPMRLRATTLRPTAAASGGSTVRSSEGLTMRTRSSGWPTMRGASASRYIVMSGSSGIAGCYLLKDLERHLHPPKRRAHLDSLHHLLHAREHVARDRDALGERRFFASLLRLPHALQDFVRDRHARDFVRQELRVAQADQRPNPGDDGRSELLHLLEKRFELARVEDRLGDREFGPGLHFPRKPRQLTVLFGGAGIHAHANRPLGHSTKRVVAGVESLIQTIDQVRETDRVDVEDCRRVRVRAHLGRIAGDDQDVAQSRGMRADDVGEHPEEIAIPAAVVNHRLDSHLAFD